MEERREGTRKRRPTKVFKFEPGHTLFASLTRKSEENIKKKKSNAEGQKRFRTKQIDQKNPTIICISSEELSISSKYSGFPKVVTL